MTQEMVFLLIFAAIVVAFVVIRQQNAKKLNGKHETVIICKVTYRDKDATLGFLNKYFESNLINILNVKCHIENGEKEDLYIDTYKLSLSENLTAVEVVGDISGCATVLSVHTLK